MKKTFLVTIFCFASVIAFAQSNNFAAGSVERNVANAGIGLGTVIAVVASWSKNKSILWAILHGFLSWIYVIYYAFNRN